MHLRLTRVGNVIKGWYSHDGEAWELVHELEVDLSYQLQVGVYGINTANAEHRMVFKDLQILKNANSEKP